MRAYPVLARAVEEGVHYGYSRAHKHADAPTREAIFEAITMAVMSSIADAFAIDREDDDV